MVLDHNFGFFLYLCLLQLQTVSSDELDGKLLQLYEYERSRKPGKYVDSVYYEDAHVLLHEENIYRFDFVGPLLLVCFCLWTSLFFLFRVLKVN